MGFEKLMTDAMILAQLGGSPGDSTELAYRNADTARVQDVVAIDPNGQRFTKTIQPIKNGNSDDGRNPNSVIVPTNEASARENFGFLQEPDAIRVNAGDNGTNTPMAGQTNDFSAGVSTTIPMRIAGRQVLTGGMVGADGKGGNLNAYTVVKFPGLNGKPDMYVGFKYDFTGDSTESKNVYSLVGGMDANDFTVAGSIGKGSSGNGTMDASVDWKQSKFALSFSAAKEFVPELPWNYKAGATFDIGKNRQMDINFGDYHHIGKGHDLKFGVGYTNDWKAAFNYKVSLYLQSIKDTKTWSPHGINGAGVNLQLNFNVPKMMRK